MRCRPRALSSPRAWQASSSSCSRRSSALPASRRERNSHSTEWSKPGSASSSPSRYFQSIRARTASAARRSGRFSRNCRMVTRASRHGGSPGWPSLGNRSAKSASAKMAPSSSRRLRRGLPLRKAASRDARRLLGHGLDQGGFERHGRPPAGWTCRRIPAHPGSADFANGIRPFSGYRNAHDGRPRQCWSRDLRKRYPVTTLPPIGRVDVYRRKDRAVSAADRHVRAGLNLSASPAAIAHAAFGTARLS